MPIQPIRSRSSNDPIHRVEVADRNVEQLCVYVNKLEQELNAIPRSAKEQTTDHGTLTGRGDDDHTIYLLADGTRDVSGDLTISGSLTVQTNLTVSSLTEGYVPKAGTDGLLEDSVLYAASTKLGINTASPYSTVSAYAAADDVWMQFATSNTGNSSATDGARIGIERSGINDHLVLDAHEYEADIIMRPGHEVVVLATETADAFRVTVSSTDYFLVNDNGAFVQNGGMRISSGTTTTDPGDGNLYVEGTISSGTIVEDSDGTTMLVSDGGQIKYRTVSESVLTGAIDHGGLTGRGDDDHTQYLLADGTRTLSGNLTITGSILETDNTSSLELYGATSNTTGPHILMWGRDHAANAGEMHLVYGGYNSTGELYVKKRNSTNTETVVTISSGGNVTLAGRLTIHDLPVGSSDLVLTHFGGGVQYRTIDSRVWGSTLLSASLSNGYIPVANGTNSLTNSIVQADASTVTIGGNILLGSNSISNDGTGGLTFDTDGLATISSSVSQNNYLAIDGDNTRKTYLGPVTGSTYLSTNRYFNGSSWISDVTDEGTVYIQHADGYHQFKHFASGSGSSTEGFMIDGPNGFVRTGHDFRLGSNSISNDGTGGLVFDGYGGATLTHNQSGNNGLSVVRTGNTTINLVATASVYGGGLVTNGDPIFITSNNDVTAPELKVDSGTVTIDPGTQAYTFGNDVHYLTLIGQDASKTAQLALYPNLRDNTKSSTFVLGSLGKVSEADREFGAISKGAAGSLDIYTASNGTGSDRPIRLAAGSSNLGSQLNLATTGYVGIGTESPQSLLSLHKGSVSDVGLQFTNSNTGNSGTSDGARIYLDSDGVNPDDLVLETNERDAEIVLKPSSLVRVDLGSSAGDAFLVYAGSSDMLVCDDDGLYVKNGGLRVSSGSTQTNPGAGNLHVEGNATIAGSLSVDTIGVESAANLSISDSVDITGALTTTLEATVGQSLTSNGGIYAGSGYHLRNYADTGDLKVLYRDSGDNTIINAESSSDSILFRTGYSSTGVWIDSNGLTVNTGTLDVNGTCEFNNVHMFTNSISYNGTGGLTFDSSGNATQTGSLTVSGNLDITGSISEVNDSSAITIFGGTSNSTGPSIELYARDHTSLAGNAYYRYGGYDATGTMYFQHRTSSSFTNVLALGSSKNATFYGSVKLNNLSDIDAAKDTRKTTDETTDSASLQNDNHLTFTAAANTTYYVDYELFVNLVSSASNEGFKFDITGPSSPTAVAYRAYGISDTDGLKVPSSGEATSFSTSRIIAFSQGSTHDGVVRIRLYLSNGANSGSVTLRWAWETGGGLFDFLTVYKESFMTVKAVA